MSPRQRERIQYDLGCAQRALTIPAHKRDDAEFLRGSINVSRSFVDTALEAVPEPANQLSDVKIIDELLLTILRMMSRRDSREAQPQDLETHSIHTRDALRRLRMANAERDYPLSATWTDYFRDFPPK